MKTFFGGFRTLTLCLQLFLLPVSASALEPVSLQLKWHHQFQFAGYYVAKELGFYRNAGLEVEIREAGSGVNEVAEVVSGRADFGVSGSGLLVARSLGKPVVALAAIFQQSPMVFLALSSSGIRAPQDFVGKKVMLTPGYNSLPLVALLHQEKLLDKIERIDTSYDPHALLDGRADLFNAYRANEPYVLRSEGVEANLIAPEDYGIRFYGDTLFTSHQLLENRPELVAAFRQASLNGWAYAVAHPDEAIQLIRGKYSSKKTLDQLRFEAREILKVIQADLVDIGTMGSERWGQISNYLIAIGAISPQFNLPADFIYSPPRRVRWIDFAPWFGGGGVALALLLVVVTTLARANLRLKKIQQQLAASEKKFRHVVNHQKDAIFLHPYTKQGFHSFTEVNDTAVALYGYSREELLRLSADDLTDKATLARHFDSPERELLGKGLPVVFESLHRKKDGATFPVEISTALIELNEEEYFLSSVRDISFRRDADEKLRESEEKFRVSFFTSPDAVNLTRIETGEYVDANEGFLRLTGYTREEVVGKSSLDLNIWKHAEDREQLISGLKEKGYVENLEARFRGKKGDVIIGLMSARIITIGGEPMILSITRDITDRIRAEEARFDLEKQLSQKHKMEAIGVLAGGMAHNFNNNLSIILGNLEMAKLKMVDIKALTRYIDNAKTALLRSRDLIKQILIYARNVEEELKLVRVAAIVEETCQLMQVTIPSTIDFNLEFSPATHETCIEANASRIQEALINLCNNSVQAMNERGTLSVYLNLGRPKPSSLSGGRRLVEKEFVCIAVADTGCGIAEADLEKIFDPFFTTKEEGQGTGMGLSTVRGIVESHQGIVEAESTLGVGTTIKLFFPIVDERLVEAVAEDIALRKGAERILFVDDEEKIALLGKDLLEVLGYQVTTFTEAQQALDLFSKDPEKFDLVLTDQTMPRMTGLEFAERLKQLRPDLPIVLCTGFSTQISSESAAKAGIKALCMKPLQLEELGQIVRNCLDHA